MRISLLVTCVGGALAPILVDQISKSSFIHYELYGADADINNQLSLRYDNQLSALFSLPTGDHPDYIQELCTMVSRYGIQVILPGSDNEAYAMSKNREEILSIGCVPLVSDIHCLDLIRDKAKTYQTLASHNMLVPQSSEVTSVSELSEAIHHHGYPNRSVVCKPTTGRGGRDIFVLIGRDNPPDWLGRGARERRVKEFDIDEMIFDHSNFGRLIVMPVFSTPAYDVDIVKSSENQVVTIPRERLNPVGIPFDGNRIARNEEIQQYCASLADILGLSAIHDADLLSDVDGKPMLLEVNPRPSGSMAVSLFAGYPLVDIAVSEALELNNPISVNISNETVLLKDNYLIFK